MFNNTNFGRTVDMLQNYMDVQLLKRRVIANNMANADTPNFKRNDVSFESELKRALDSENAPGLQARVSNERHIAFKKPMDWREVQPRRFVDYLTTSDNNGNNVTIESEVENALKTQMVYTLLTTAASDQFNQVNMVLR